MNALLLLSAFKLRGAWRLARRRVRRVAACERFFAQAVDHCDLKERMSRWEHTAAQVRAPW